MSPEKLRVFRRLQAGLPLVPEPYRALAEELGCGEELVIATARECLRDGSIRRFGLVVSHRRFGYEANAMCVWSIPEAGIQELGARMAEFPFVSLCYQRRSSPPEWPYNLYCMIHAKTREEARLGRERLVKELELGAFPSAVLFSTRCFVQRGAWQGKGATV